MNNSNHIVLLYVPCGSEEEAQRLAGMLLRERLIACANVYASRSFYIWKEQMADETEHVLICKTVRTRAAAAEKRISEMHSYELPCVLRIQDVEANREYAAWVREQIAAPGVPHADKVEAPDTTKKAKG